MTVAGNRGRFVPRQRQLAAATDAALDIRHEPVTEKRADHIGAYLSQAQCGVEISAQSQIGVAAILSST